MTNPRGNLMALVLTLMMGGLLALQAAGQGNGQFLCSAGSRDGMPCEGFTDCPGGVCVIAQGVCPDAFICDCPGGHCSNDATCPDEPSFGTCADGVVAGLCCDVALECLDGGACVGTQKICIDGLDQGFSCLDNSQCDSGNCASTGCFCDGGDFDSYACGTGNDCPGGTCNCSFGPTPTPLPTVRPCVGDCSRDLAVTVDEIVAGVNIALGEMSVSSCPRFDSDSNSSVTVDEILAAISNALSGCPR